MKGEFIGRFGSRRIFVGIKEFGEDKESVKVAELRRME